MTRTAHVSAHVHSQTALGAVLTLSPRCIAGSPQEDAEASRSPQGLTGSQGSAGALVSTEAAGVQSGRLCGPPTGPPTPVGATAHDPRPPGPQPVRGCSGGLVGPAGRAFAMSVEVACCPFGWPQSGPGNDTAVGTKRCSE